MKKFSEIEQFRHVVKSVQYYFETIGKSDLPNYTFVGYVKLHGTNAGVQRYKNEFKCQSRKNWIDPSNDNYGFATWFETLDKDLINNMFDKISTNPNDKVTIYGEWCGPGIQSKVGLCDLPTKQWVIFGAWLNDEYVENFEELCVPELNIHNVMIGGRFSVHVDFNNPGDSIEHFERMTLAVEEHCPYSKQFGVDGIGEGIVWHCKQRPTDSGLWFKTKGDKHSGKKSKREVANVDPQKVKDINDCVDVVLPEWRLAQGIEQLGKELTMKLIGPYLAWVNKDVRKEEMDIIEANGLEWKEVSKEITNRAKKYFTDQYNTF